MSLNTIGFPEFVPFPKIPRVKRACVVTEKIDGTNAQIYIDDFGAVFAGSRNRWLTAEHDNYGFFAWVAANAEELRKLGPGRHYGEWWGAGIQRRYGLTEKRFSLFNVSRWSSPEIRPACCGVVPVLYHGDFTTTAIDECVERLRASGSVAAPGFMQPEGVVVFHAASSTLYKRTLENDDKAKGQVES